MSTHTTDTFTNTLCYSIHNTFSQATFPTCNVYIHFCSFAQVPHAFYRTHGEEVWVFPTSGQFYIQPCFYDVNGRLHTIVGVMMEKYEIFDRFLVTDYVTMETPLFSGNVRKQLFVCTRRYSVNPSKVN